MADEFLRVANNARERTVIPILARGAEKLVKIGEEFYPELLKMAHNAPDIALIRQWVNKLYDGYFSTNRKGSPYPGGTVRVGGSRLGWDPKGGELVRQQPTIGEELDITGHELGHALSQNKFGAPEPPFSKQEVDVTLRELLAEGDLERKLIDEYSNREGARGLQHAIIEGLGRQLTRLSWPQGLRPNATEEELLDAIASRSRPPVASELLKRFRK